MAELLLELFSEEIPAGMQRMAASKLAELVTSALRDDGVETGRVHPFWTPRRIGFVTTDVALESPDQETERRGPAADAPEKAREGFLRSLEGKNHEIQTREDKKGPVLFAIIREKGRPTSAILRQRLPALIEGFAWPKSMRWSKGSLQWVRPLHSILCLFDGAIVPFTVAGIESGGVTRGHRFSSPQPFSVRGCEDYCDKLGHAHVLLQAEKADENDRRTRVEKGARTLAAEAGLDLEEDPALIDEITGLVEWPVPLMGRIDAEFMDLPPELLVLTMRTNQKYLALRSLDGALAPRFITVANIEALDGGAAIIAGNERVLRARLHDAKFFWEQDRKDRLESRLPQLDKVVFHEKLGTLGQRVERLVALCGAIAGHIEGADAALAERAALLCKADLVTGMVGEFPELQGVMGGYYARHQGEAAAVATAIREHYSPRGPDDPCPSSPVSVVVALVEKIDTLAGFFAIGMPPTGSKDPFALRRAALGVIRLVVQNGLRLDLAALFRAALRLYGRDAVAADTRATVADLKRFIEDRLVVQQRAAGQRHDLVEAVFATLGADDESPLDLVGALARVEALSAFLTSEDGANLLAGYKRAANIVAIESRKDKRSFDEDVDPACLGEAAERALFDALAGQRAVIEDALATEDFRAAMNAVAGLRGPIDDFFEAVMVNVDDARLRANRLFLLASIGRTLDSVADFSKIEDVGRTAV